VLRTQDDSPTPAVVAARNVGGYLVATAVVVLSAGSCLAAGAVVQTAAFLAIFALGVIVVAARFGIGPALWGAFGGVLTFDFLLVPPTLSFAVHRARDGVMLGLMLAVAMLASVVVEQLRRRLRSAQRQACAERLRNGVLSALSHDLRTPLTTIVGASAALCEDGLGSGERSRFSQILADEAVRLDRLVSRLLELARLEARPTAGVRPAQAIDEVIGAALHRLEQQLRGRRVVTDVPEELPLAEFDPVLIEQVMVNLVENALNHAGRESPIEISARFARGTVVVEVADRGPGVVCGDEERVFEKLYRGVRRGHDRGTGLGLTICRAILTAHGGRIWLENRRGGGAVVRFSLPAPPTAPVIARQRADAPVWSSRRP
jgi:two-component system sensor histidine kinase KdpD